MKTMHTVTVILLFLFPVDLFSQIGEISWEQSLELPGIDYYKDVVEDSGKGFAILGAQAKQERSFDLWLVKTDFKGDTIWTRTFGTTHKEIPRRIVHLSDDSFLLLGAIIKEDVENSLLVKVDSMGNEVWRKSFDNDTIVKDMVSLEEGNFAIAGAMYMDSINPRLWMATMDGSGEMIWEKILQKDTKGCVKSLKKLPDGGFAVAGQVSENGDNDCDIIAFRTNNLGTPDWFTWFRNPKQKVWPECICCSVDSCFIVVGWRGKCMNDINSNSPVFDFDMVVNKINCKGDVEWIKSFDREGSEGGNAIAIRPDGNFIVAGIKLTSFLGKIGPWLVQVDTDGNEIDEKLLKFRFNKDHASRIINCSDGGFIVIGPGIQDETNRHSNGWIVKFEAL